jgi:glucosylceramidase
MLRTDRRRFLALTASAAASYAVSSQTTLRAFAAAASPARAWRTTPAEKFQPVDIGGWQPAGGASQPAIQVNAARRFQTILGFGGAFTDASCYLLSRMDAAARQQLLESLVGGSGLNLSVGRISIGASDYSRNAYSYDDSPGPDPQLAHFSIDHDKSYILPTLRDVQKLNPEMFYFGAPWSPPGWMKAGGSMLGGSMRKKYFPEYAQYFVKFLQAYQAEGVKVRAVTTQNEVDTDQDGRMPAALWGQEYEAGFIKEHLGPALQQHSPETLIWLLDHNYDLWGRALDELSEPEVSKYVDGVAWHGYMGSPEAMTRVHDAFPKKHAYWTEGGPDISSPDYATDWSKWSSTFAGILRNWARTIVSWNVVLDEKGGPNIGPFACGGLVTLDSKTQQVRQSGQYWAFAHYSKAIRRGAAVVETRGTIKDVDHVAVSNPDGSHVLVVTNRGPETELQCVFEGQSLRLRTPADSITTLTW